MITQGYRALAGQQRRLVNRLLLATAVVVAVGVTVVGGYVLRMGAPASVWLIGAVATGIAFALLLLLFTVNRRLFDDVERLRGDILVAASGLRDLPPIWSAKPEQTDELIHLTDAVIDFGVKADARHAATKDQLATVLAGVEHPILMVTHSGIVNLYNRAAERMFGATALHLGASIFSLFDAVALRNALQDIEQARTVTLTLAAILHPEQPEQTVELRPLQAGGFILMVPPEQQADWSQTRTSASTQANAQAITDQTPLDQLPVTVFDCETTGLNAMQDRMVSFGTIRMVGTRQFPLSAMDVVINPGRSIPSLATSIHGITDSVVAHAPRFAEVWPGLSSQLEGTVMVGHHIAFDVGFIENELSLAKQSWDAPKLLDTARIIRLLKGLHHDPSLDEAAAMYGLNAMGRHSALGDTLLTATLYARLVEELAAVGITSFGDLRDALSAGRLQTPEKA